MSVKIWAKLQKHYTSLGKRKEESKSAENKKRVRSNKIPKGEKAVIKEKAAAVGQSVNEFVYIIHYFRVANISI